MRIVVNMSSFIKYSITEIDITLPALIKQDSRLVRPSTHTNIN
jgi:hypothetical protein